MNNKITMIEMFAGIGAQERALRRLPIQSEVIATMDVDKDAILSYACMRYDFDKELSNYVFPSKSEMISELQSKNVGFDFIKNKHTITERTNEDKIKQYYLADKLSKNLGDVSKASRLPYADIVTYSFPCTNLSVAGKGEGMVNKCECGYSWPIDFSDESKALICPQCGKTVSRSTCSGLLGQVQRLLTIAKDENTLPQYLLLENVKNLVGSKFKPQFDAWITWLDSIGYTTYYKVLNAKKYGIPQNRERVFAVSIRKDIKADFIWPTEVELTTCLKDILEKNVDEKYYLPDERINKILNSSFMQEKTRIQTTNVCDTLLARDYKDPKCVPVKDEPFIVASRGRDTVTEAHTEQHLEPNFTGCSNCLTSVCKDNYIAEPIVYDDYNSNIPKDQDAIITLTTHCGAGAERNGVKIIERFYANREPRIYGETSPTLRSERIGLEVADSNWRIRKLTAKECWRLMGFSDSDADKASKYVSSSALYKQAGNSIVVSVLTAIFSALLLKEPDIWPQHMLHFYE